MPKTARHGSSRRTRGPSPGLQKLKDEAKQQKEEANAAAIKFEASESFDIAAKRVVKARITAEVLEKGQFVSIEEAQHLVWVGYLLGDNKYMEMGCKRLKWMTPERLISIGENPDLFQP